MEEEEGATRWKAGLEKECKLLGVARRKGRWERWGWGRKRKELCTLRAGCAPGQGGGEGVVPVCSGGEVAGKRNAFGEDEHLYRRGCGGAACIERGSRRRFLVESWVWELRVSRGSGST